MICYAPLREIDYLIMKFDLISVIFRNFSQKCKNSRT